MVGVDAQDFQTDARRFIERYETTYPHVYDGRGSTLGRYGVRRISRDLLRRQERPARRRARMQGPVTAEQLDRNIELALESSA